MGCGVGWWSGFGEAVGVGRRVGGQDSTKRRLGTACPRPPGPTVSAAALRMTLAAVMLVNATNLMYTGLRARVQYLRTASCSLR